MHKRRKTGQASPETKASVLLLRDHERWKRTPWAQQVKAAALYQRADQYWSRSRLKPAFRFFLAAAKEGETSAFGPLAQFYDLGKGVKADEEAALYWYRRAYFYGSSVAANNIGCIWRDRGKLARALMWFRRAVRLGDAESNLNIAKIYLRKRDPAMAIRHLERTRKAPNVTQGSKEEARDLLKQIKQRNDSS